jgi:hypothetical protein
MRLKQSLYKTVIISYELNSYVTLNRTFSNLAYKRWSFHRVHSQKANGLVIEHIQSYYKCEISFRKKENNESINNFLRR